MKNYVKPMVVANDGLAESVYMASGESDCWTIEGKSVQEWDGGANVFELHAVHATGLQHISRSTSVTVAFSNTLDAGKSRSEFPGSVSGNTISFTRELLGDAYGSGDQFTCKVWASTGDEATTKALTITGLSISCDHQVNVQGKFD